jgi:RNA polymerase sigma factor (sigma-70 family)
MSGASNYDSLDLLTIGDEQLVILYRDGKHARARDELILRHHHWVHRVAAFFAKKSNLRPDLLPDAKQIASMALLEAIDKYDPERVRGPARCSFRTFLGTVFRNRFIDFLKKTRRAERPIDRSRLKKRPNTEKRKTAASRNDRGWFLDSSLEDPALLTQRGEELTRLRQAVEVLSSSKHMIFERLSEGDNLSAISKEMGISYDATRRLLQKMLKLLQQQLKSPNDSSQLER